MSTEIYTYADGFGRWHALTKDTPLGLTRAINAIVEELKTRGEGAHGTAREYVERNIISLPLSEWDTSPAYGGVPVPAGAWIHFAEYRIN